MEALIPLLMGGGPTAVLLTLGILAWSRFKALSAQYDHEIRKINAKLDKIDENLQQIVQKSIRDVETIKGDVKELSTRAEFQQKELDRHDNSIERLQEAAAAH
jgi:Skp family chaperone for outer membrane proteins